MKKQILTVAMIGAAVFALAYGSFAFAQTETPAPAPYGGYGMMEEGGSMMDNGVYHNGMVGDGMMTEGDHDQGMMGDGGHDHDMRGDGMGMMGGHGEMGALHEFMYSAMADALGLTPEEFQARHEAGETFWEIAKAQGLSEEEVRVLMEDTHDEAIEQAVADGMITEELASQMLNHMEDHREEGADHSGSHCNEEKPAGLDL